MKKKRKKQNENMVCIGKTNFRYNIHNWIEREQSQYWIQSSCARLLLKFFIVVVVIGFFFNCCIGTFSRKHKAGFWFAKFYPTTCTCMYWGTFVIFLTNTVYQRIESFVFFFASFKHHVDYFCSKYCIQLYFIKYIIRDTK